MVKQKITITEADKIWSRSAGERRGVDAQYCLDDALFAKLEQWDERTARARGERQVFKWYSKYAAPAGYVGVLQHGGLFIEILPKVTQTQDEEALRTAKRNLRLMLRYAMGAKVRNIGEASQRLEDAPISELVIELFAKELLEQLKQGVHHSYRERQESLGVLRGRLELGRHLRENYARQDRFAVRHEVFETDTRLNRILKAACLSVIKITRSHKSKQVLSECLLSLDEVCAVEPQQLGWESLVLDRGNARFERALLMAKMLLQGLNPSGQRGGDEVFALLYEMDSLYERFVAGFIRREVLPALEGEGWELVTQGGKPAQYVFPGAKTAHLKPDLMLRSGDRCLVMDTKWKHLSSTKANGKSNARDGISVTDLYQMLVYGYVFSSATVLLIYPQPLDQEVIERRYGSRIKLEDTDHAIHVASFLLPLDQDLSVSRDALRDAFVERLREELTQSPPLTREQGMRIGNDGEQFTARLSEFDPKDAYFRKPIRLVVEPLGLEISKRNWAPMFRELFEALIAHSSPRLSDEALIHLLDELQLRGGTFKLSMTPATAGTKKAHPLKGTNLYILINANATFIIEACQKLLKAFDVELSEVELTYKDSPEKPSESDDEDDSEDIVDDEATG